MEYSETLGAGLNFDGTAGSGLIDFPTFAPVDGSDNQRIQVLTFSIAIGQSNGNARLKDVYLVYAATLADAVTNGKGWIFASDTDVHQFTSLSAITLLPNWSGFVFAQEASGSFIKSFTLDWVRVDLGQTVKGEPTVTAPQQRHFAGAC